MRAREILRKAWALPLDLLEIYLPMTTFVIMLSAFALQIFTRYVLNNPWTWPYEVSVFAYIWTCLLGAAYARRHNAHVSFTLLYERLGPRAQRITRIAANLLIATAFLLALFPTYSYVRFIKFQKSTILRIPYNILYAPILVFFALIIGRAIQDVVADLKAMRVQDTSLVGRGTPI